MTVRDLAVCLAVTALYTNPINFNALADGDLFDADVTPLAAVHGGSAAGVPLLISSNMREMTDFGLVLAGGIGNALLLVSRGAAQKPVAEKYLSKGV